MSEVLSVAFEINTSQPGYLLKKSGSKQILNGLRATSWLLTLSSVNALKAATRETCEIRGWALYAINVRTNHVHTVVSIGEKKPEVALNAFKANATRKMREHGCWQSTRSPWSDKGSKRYLWNERSIERAVEYVVNGQGDDLPDFDD